MREFRNGYELTHLFFSYEMSLSVLLQISSFLSGKRKKKKWGNSILMERTISFCRRTTSYEVQLQYLPFQPEYNVKVLFSSFMQF